MRQVAQWYTDIPKWLSNKRKFTMKILIVLTSHDQLGDTGKKLVSGWKNSPLLITY